MFPCGWYRIGDASEVKNGGVLPLHFFDRDFVLWRSENGEAVCFDAHCPHAGAHLGQGGRVDGDTIACPFHGWRYGRDGRCVSVPYIDRQAPKASVRRWPLVEQAENLWLYFSAEEEETSPALALSPWQGEWSPLFFREWTFRGSVVDVAENIPDGVHFRYVHNTASLPDTHAEIREGKFCVKSSMRQHTPRGEVDAVIESVGHFAGCWVIRFTGIVETVFIAATTPIDKERVHMRVMFRTKETKTSRTGRALIDHICAQVEQDIPIWENKARIERPIFLPEDGPLQLFRRWIAAG